jgi:adenine-specific DNA-methyltransferase
MLEPVEQVGDASSQNLLIQGDNLEALKALLPFYAGRVKCIFIDPPYNTKSAFEHYDDNLEHSQWLSMMYPRLELLRDLLSEDGSIWVTIDDNEAHYLKVVMDEVFGRKNFIANVVWQKKSSAQPNAVWLSDSHDHVLVFSKNKSIWRPNRLPRSEKHNEIYKHSDEFDGMREDGTYYGRGPWFPGDATASLRGGARGAQFARTGESANIYTIRAPNGREMLPPPGTCWRFSKERFDELVSENRITFGKTGGNRPCLKRFLTDMEQVGIVPMTVWHYSEVGENRIAASEVKNFNSADPFTTPKPEKLLRHIIHLASEIGDLVLDSYLGSGTTAAVAHKMGRRYIGIEMGEHAVTHCLPRLKKVIDGEQGGISEAVGWKGGGGFRFMKLGEPVFLDDGRINPAVRFATLASYLWFLEAGAPHATNKFDTPLLGIMGGEQNEDGTSSPRTAIILLYNGILGDKRPQAGNVLTTPIWNGILAQLPAHNGPRVIYGEACRLSPQRLKQLGVTFKQIPYDIRMR